MPTNQEIIDSAGYALGYIEYGVAMDATDSADALDAFNQMMTAWRQAGKDLNWFTQDTLAGDCPIPDWSEEGVINNLAMKLSTRFNIAPTGQLVQDARDGSKLITRTLANEQLDNISMTHLPLGAGRRSRYDIDTDTY